MIRKITAHVLIFFIFLSFGKPVFAEEILRGSGNDSTNSGNSISDSTQNSTQDSTRTTEIQEDASSISTENTEDLTTDLLDLLQEENLNSPQSEIISDIPEDLSTDPSADIQTDLLTDPSIDLSTDLETDLQTSIPDELEQDSILENLLPDTQQSTEILPQIATQIAKNIEDRKPAGNNFHLQADSATGALYMEYPISIPPGRNGIQPDLSLIYNSQNNSDNNLFGHGWSINIPYIERINKKGLNTLYSDNFFNSSLTGELQSITLTDTTHGAYGSKIDSGDFLKYEYKTGNYWEVTDKSGTTYKFGYTQSSRQDDPSDSSKVSKWMLSEIRNPNNNYIKYEYLKDNGQIYPLNINYTGNGFTDGIFSVQFIKENRPDQNISYETGFKVTTQYRISSIEINNSDNTKHFYNIYYTSGDNGQRSLIEKITEGGSGSTSAFLPSEKFEYQKTTEDWAYQSSYSIPVDLWNGYDEYSGARIFDVNGDALNDIVSAKEGYQKAIYINKGDDTGWQLNNNYYLPVNFVNKYGGDLGVRIADVNGDGLADLIEATSSSKKVYLNNATGWAYAASYTEFPVQFVKGQYNEPTGARMTEINGDGLIDIIQAGSGSYAVYLNKADNTGWKYESSYNVPTELGKPGSVIADINGDGLDDILYSREGSYQAIYTNNGKNFEQNVTYSIPVYFATTNGGDNGVRIEDANGDGLLDLFYAKDNDWTNRKVYINKGDGTGWQASGIYDIPKPFIVDSGTSDNGVRLADVNGDGLADFLYRNDSAPISSGESNNKTYIHQGKVPELLINFYNKKGGKIKVNYSSTAQYKDNASLLNPKLPFVLQTVKSIYWFDNINADPSTVQYKYSGGEYYYKDALNRKFAGFKSIKETNDSGNYTITYFHQGNGNITKENETMEYNDAPSKISYPYSIEKYNQNNNLYSKTIQRFDNYSLGNNREFVGLSQITELNYDGNFGSKAKAEKYTYDLSNGNITQKTLMGEVNSSPSGDIISDMGTDKFTIDISYAIDSNKKILNKPAVETVKDQNSSLVSQIQYNYDNLALYSVSKGNLTKQSSWVSGNSYVNSTRIYNSYGLVTQSTDGLGNITTYQYDNFNLYPIKITNALNQSENFTFDYSSGKIKQYIDLNGKKFETVYDLFDRPIEEKQPDLSNPANLVSHTLYYYYDNVFPSYTLKWQKTTASYGPAVYTYFDGFNRPIQVRKEIEDPSIFAVTDYKYNKLGLIEKYSLPYISTGFTKTSPTTNDKLYIKYSYDPLNRITNIQNTLGTTSYTYDDWKTVIKDAQNNSKDLYNDAYGNLIKVVEYNEGSSYTTQYQYNGLGMLTKITDALNNIQNFTYDGLGRRISMEDLHASVDNTFGSYTFTYDNANNLISKKDTNGQIINYTYDKLNRLIFEDFTGQAGIEATYQYDTCSNGIGKLCSVLEGNILSSYTYNQVGSIASEKLKIDNKEYLTQFGYDWQKNLLSLIYPDNSIANYTYNQVGKIKSIKYQNKDIIKNITYAPTEAMEKIEYANGVTTTNTFDSNNLYRLTQKSSKVQSIQYTYDKIGNITKIIDSSNPTLSKTANYTYDNLSRLKSATITNSTNNYTHQFQYNAIGNITSKTGQGTYSYNGNQGVSYATPHAVTNIGTTVLTYDKNGNLLSDGKQTLKWNYKNRLIEAAVNGKTIKYYYDYNGNRIKKSEGTNNTLYINKFYEIRSDKIVNHIYAFDDNVASVGISTLPAIPPDEIMLEDAEDGDVLGWMSYTTGKKITNLYDDEKKSKIINLDYYSGYQLNNEDGSNWNDTTHKVVSWDMKNTNTSYFRFVLDTNNGQKSITYTNYTSAANTANGIYVILSQSLFDGKWHTITKDMQADLSAAQPSTTINKVLYMQTWWGGKMDNIKLLKSMPTTGTPTSKTIYHHQDHLSGANIETNESGNVIELTDYYPFGEIRTDQTTTAYKNPYKFTGKELDTDTGLYYYGARYYNATIGRFISQDPWGGILSDPQTLNKYSYVMNNPLKYTDPSGKSIMSFLYDTAKSALEATVDFTASTAYEYLDSMLYDVFPDQDYDNASVAEQIGGEVGNQLAVYTNYAEIVIGPTITSSSGPALATCLVTGGGGCGVAAGTSIVGTLITWHGASNLMYSKGKGIEGKMPDTDPNDFTKLKGNQGWKDKNGNTWKKDKFHNSDHWDVSDKSGNKIDEISRLDKNLGESLKSIKNKGKIK